MLESTFGPYRIEELLGRGGMGEVYRAHDTETDRRVALKVLPAHLAEDTEYQERFRRECRAAARLREPHIVPIHRFGEIDGRLYLDMRLVEGMDLASWLKQYGAMPPEAAVSVVSQIAAALDSAHAEGLVHRDVKPSNVLLAGVTGGTVDREVFAYLFDFGIARAQEGVGDDPALTRAGTMPGSLAYIAPERFAGVEGDPRADVYSLACVLHQSLTGRPPFEGDMATLMNAHLNAPPPRPSSSRPDLPSGMDQVVAQGMAKDPARRTASAGALAAAARAEIGVWRTDPGASGSTVAWSSKPDLSKPSPTPPAPGTAVIPPGWGSSPQAAPSWNPGQQSNPGWSGAGQGGGQQGGYGAAPQPAYGQQGGYGQGGGQQGGYGQTSQPSQPNWNTQQAWSAGTQGSNPSYPAYTPPPAKKSRTGVIVAAVLAGLVVIGAGIVIAVAVNGGGGGPVAAPPTSTSAAPVTTAPPSTTTSAPPTASAASAELLAILPLGYSAANCSPDDPAPSAAVTVACNGAPSTGETSPDSAAFNRYESVSVMNAQMDAYAANESLSGDRQPLDTCATNSNARANYIRQGGGLGGQIICFTDAGTGVAYLAWTDDAAIGIGFIASSSGDAAGLYTWWNANDFSVAR